MLSGRAVNVPTIDEISYQKAKLRYQLWKEDQQKLSSFKPQKAEDIQGMAQEFSEYMQELSDKRNEALDNLSRQLNEDRYNWQHRQQSMAFGLARISPAACYSLAVSYLAGSSLEQKRYFKDAAAAYQETFGKFILEKTGMNLGGGLVMVRVNDDQTEPEPINPEQIPPFLYKSQPLAVLMNQALPDITILVLFNLIFYSCAFVAFMKYDVR